MGQGGDVMKLKKVLSIWAIIFILLVITLFTISTYFQAARNAYFSMSCDGEQIFEDRMIDMKFDYQDVSCDDIDLLIEVR